MKDPGDEREVVVSLPIRVRRTEYGLGEYTEVSSVGCPIVSGDVPLTRCEKCERARAVLGGEEGRVLQCQVPASVLQKQSRSGLDLQEKLRRTQVSEVMTSSVTCVDSELELKELSKLLQTLGLRGAPVVEDQGVLLGMISVEDARLPPDSAGLLVEDVLTGEVVALHETSSLTDAMQLMAAQKLHRVAVVSSNDVVVGILSLVDLARWIARENGGE